MAPVDANIPLASQFPHLLSPLEAQSQVGQVRAQQQQQAMGQQQMQLNDAALQQHQLQVAAAQREANEEQALRGMFAQGTPTVKDLIPVVGPDRAVKILTGLSALQEAAKTQARTDYTGSQTLIKDTLAGMDALPEALRAQTYPAVRNVLVTQGHIDPAQVPEQYDPAWWQQARSYGQAQEKPVSVAPGGSLVNPQTGKELYKAPDAPSPAMKEYRDYVNETVKAGGKPMEFNAYMTMDANRKAPRTIIPGAAQEEPLSDAAMDIAARNYLRTGQLPPMGMGAAAAVNRRQVLNRAALLDPNANIAANAAEFAADKGSLGKMQQMRDAVGAFEKTARANLDILIEQGRKIVDTGSPWINTPIRALSAKVVGDTNVPAYEAARRVAVNEIAKVTSNPSLAGQLSDSARREVEDFNPSNATFAQTVAVAEILSRDMKNRMSSLDEGLSAIKGRTKQSAVSGAAPSSGPKMIRAKDPQGNIHEAPAGTALPAGWTLVGG